MSAKITNIGLLAGKGLDLCYVMISLYNGAGFFGVDGWMDEGREGGGRRGGRNCGGWLAWAGGCLLAI